MNLNIIIHALIIIFILHIILINIKYSVTIGYSNKNNVEKMTNQKEFYIGEKNKDDESIDFLLGNNNKKDDLFKKKMNDYIKDIQFNKTETKSFDDKNEFPVEASNNYLDNKETPNFESNVIDTSKFYEINKHNDNLNYDNLNEKDLKETSLSSLGISNTSPDNLFKDKNNNLTNINIDSNTVRQSTINPDNWKYKNEFPMNGGLMNGIVGFDELESQYADFGSFLQVKNNTTQPFEKIPHDDLRKPIIYNN